MSDKRSEFMALIRNPSKEMLDAGQVALDDCKDSGWDSGPDGESYNSYEYIRSDAAFVVFRTMVAKALEQVGAFEDASLTPTEEKPE